MKNKKLYLLFLIPVYLVLNMYVMSGCFSLLSESSDVAVLVGVIGLSLQAALNVLVISYVIKKFKRNEE